MANPEGAEATPAWMHDLLDQGVLITDADLTVRSWNTWLSQRSGRAAAEVLGRNLLELYPELAARQLDRVYREALAGRVQVLSQRLHRYLLPLPAPAAVAGFAQMAQSARVGPLEENGRIVGTITIIEDVTERVAREHELQRLLEQERAARAASERAEQRYRALVQVSSQAVWTTNAEGYGDAATAWWAELTGLPDAALGGGGWIEAVHPDDRASVLVAWEHSLQTRTTYEMVFRARTREGIYRQFAVRGVPLLDADGQFREWVGTLNDITEQRRSEEATALLADASATLVSSFDAGKRLQALARLVLARLADSCVIYLGEGDAALLPQIAVHSDAQQQARLDAWLQSAGPLPADCAQTERLFQVGEPCSSLQTSPERVRWPEARALFGQPALRSGVLVPLRVNSALFGVLALLITETGRCYDQFDLEVARELARRTALMLDNARAYTAEYQAREAAERATARITRLQAITAEFTQALTPTQIAEMAVRTVGGALGAVAGCVMQVSADSLALEHLYSVGYPEETQAAWRRIPLDSSSPLAEAFRTGVPVLIETEADFAGHPGLEAAQKAGQLRTLVATPLAVGPRVLGVLGLSFAEFRSFAAEDRDFLHALDQQCAQALDRAWLYEAEQHARAEAEAAVRVRDQFLSIASHELRTPLTSLLGNIQMLQRRLMRGGTLAERDQHALRVATEQALRLNQMIGMLLDVSRIEQGLLSLERVPMDVTALVRRVIEEAQPTTTQHKLLLEIPAAPLVIDGDALRLEQVIQNLLGNAIKYSPAGGEVVVRVTPRDQMACVAVSDQGIGIPKDTLPKLFQRFYRAPNALDHRIEGTGVGLYVVREIVHLHGGELHVDSIERVGSTFTVCLPLSLSAAHSSTPDGVAAGN